MQADKLDASFLPIQKHQYSSGSDLRVSDRKGMRGQKGKMEDKNGREVPIQKW